jgi:nucleoid DNA-binding protein
MDIGKYIKELLILHDCVILPGLGGFVANYRSAEINEMLKIISPPSKSILFNRNIYYNDGLLIGHICVKTGMGYKDVEIQVQGYIEKILKTTGSGTKFTIDELGFFFNDKEKKLQFQAEPGMNFLIESYSLHDVHFRELFSQAEKPVKSQSYFSQEDRSVRRRKTVRVLVYTGIAASLLAAVILIPVRTGFLNYSDLRLFRSKGDLSTDKLPEKEITITETIQKAAPATYKIEIKPAEFHIIAGSFREFGNARMLMKKLEDQGLNVHILSSGSEYFRVSAGSYPNQEDASLALSAIRELPGMDSAWLLKD